MKGTIRAICISKERGTAKYPIEQCRLIPEFGLEGDAHAGNWHRQVSLLSYEKVEAFNELGAGVLDGEFGENLLTVGLDLARLHIGTRLICGSGILEITQIGKECHKGCAIRNRVGDCIMPREGVFARVQKGGLLRPGDPVSIANGWRASVIVLSDSASAGTREDKSGPLAVSMLRSFGFETDEALVLPDEPEALKKELIRIADHKLADLIITSGGTGLSPRDWTPEATLAVADRNAPGIAEAIRAYSMTITKRAMLSRGVSVLRGETLIINLPGSPKAVKEGLEYLEDTLGHALGILTGCEKNCAQTCGN